MVKIVGDKVGAVRNHSAAKFIHSNVEIVLNYLLRFFTMKLMF